MKQHSRPRGRKPPNPSRNKRAAKSDHLQLYGVHTVLAACANPERKLHRLYVSRNIAHQHEQILKKAGCPVEILDAKDISRKAQSGAVHQGILAEASPLPARIIEDVTASGIILVLDQITDPHNVGAILRSAAALDAGAVIVTARNNPEAAGVLAKAASGALEHVPLIAAVNLARALDALGACGFLRIGFDSEAEFAIENAPLNAPLALVLGAEGKGLRRLTREKCDLLVRLDMPGPIRSLNVSNAAVLALYACRQRLR